MYTQHDGIQDRNITNYQVDLRQANSERLPDLFITVEESHIAPEQRLEVYVEGSAKSYVNVIGQLYIGQSYELYDWSVIWIQSVV